MAVRQSWFKIPIFYTFRMDANSEHQADMLKYFFAKYSADYDIKCRYKFGQWNVICDVT